MAIFNCVECGKKVSSLATLCPHCGCPVEHTLRAFAEVRKSNEEEEVAPQQNLLDTAAEEKRIEQEKKKISADHVFEEMNDSEREDLLNTLTAKMRVCGMIALILLLLSMVVAVVFALFHSYFYREVGLFVVPIFVGLGLIASAVYWLAFSAYRSKLLKQIGLEKEQQAVTEDEEEQDVSGRPEQ